MPCLCWYPVRVESSVHLDKPKVGLAARAPRQHLCAFADRKSAGSKWMSTSSPNGDGCCPAWSCTSRWPARPGGRPMVWARFHFLFQMDAWWPNGRVALRATSSIPRRRRRAGLNASHDFCAGKGYGVRTWIQAARKGRVLRGINPSQERFQRRDACIETFGRLAQHGGADRRRHLSARVARSGSQRCRTQSNPILSRQEG